jgi:hypothetical protein
MSKVFDQLFNMRSLRRWRRIASDLGSTPISSLREKRQAAARLRRQLDKIIRVADERLAAPYVGSNAFPKPAGTEWAWRPELWRQKLRVPGISSISSNSKLGDEAALFHDCSYSELTLRQVRNYRESDLAAYGVQMDVFKFDGSFLSLVIDMPADALDGLTKSHLLRVDAIIEAEKPLEVYFRLNIKHGPNTEQIVRELPQDQSRPSVEFDMAYTKLNERRVETGWLDVIFEAPEMNQVTLRDVTFARYRRAAL